MNEVLCQTRFNGLEDECGISVYVSNLPLDSDVEIYVKIGDVIIAANRDLDDPTKTTIVDFRGLVHKTLYTVNCDILENGEYRSFSIPMYAYKVSHKAPVRPNKFNGGISNSKSIRMKGVGLNGFS